VDKYPINMTDDCLCVEGIYNTPP